MAERAKSGVGGALHARMARLAFRRPPVTVIPDSDGIGSTLLRIVVFRSAVLSVQRERTRAAAPETCGVAIEVPLKYA